MRYFGYLPPQESESIFYAPPMQLHRGLGRELLAHAVGALLYMPATRHDIASGILTRKLEGLVSMGICLEDAIGDNVVEEAEQSLIGQLQELAMYIHTGLLTADDLPQIFVRVRNPQQMERLADQLEEDIALLTGFVFPKFTAAEGHLYLDTLARLNERLRAAWPGHSLYGMPILETREVIWRETRWDELTAIRSLLDHHRELVLNVRVGATDFSSLFGLRRGREHTVYDVMTIRDCLSDILNLFTRAEDGYVVSGPVWEHFETAGLLREVQLDKVNGMLGKTVIHPSHIKPVQASCVVTREEYADAQSILANNTGDIGVTGSAYANKMNEIKPHLSWARKTLMRANIYGVFHDQQHIASLLQPRIYI